MQWAEAKSEGDKVGPKELPRFPSCIQEKRMKTMTRAKGLKFALGALVLLFALVLLINLSATQAKAAPQPGEIFIDGNGDRTWNGGVVDSGLYATIQDAINATLPGNVVVVGPGIYQEEIIISTNIWLVGANENVNPNTGVRVAETVLIPRSGLNPLVMLGANNVKIDGFSFNGSNPILPGLGTLNGIDVMAPFGLANFFGENNLTFTNNIMSNLDTAMALAGTSRNNHIGNNLFDNIGPVFGVGHALQLVSGYYADVQNNVFTRASTSIFVSGHGSAGSALIDGNTLTGSSVGIVIERLSGSAGVWTVSNNVLSTASTGEAGIIVSGVEGSSAGTVLSANTINRMQYGIKLIDNPSSVGVSVLGGTITNCTYGIYAEEGAIAFVPGNSVYTISGVTIINSDSFGIFVVNEHSLGDSVTRLNIIDGNVVRGGLNGLVVQGDGAMVAFGFVAPIEFNGTTDQYIRLIDSPRDIDATQVLFDGLRAAGMTSTQLQNLEAKLWHHPDVDELGRITVFVPVEIGVLVLKDLTGDGFTANDIPLENWTVYLWKDGLKGEGMQTGSDGRFQWTELEPGDYMVSELLPSGWTATNPSQVDLGRVESSGSYVVTFTNFQNVSISVTKMQDLTGDGLTANDTPIQNWTVYLWKDGVKGAPMLTGVDGTFTWADLGPGSYKVSELLPTGWTAKNVTEHEFGVVASGGSYDFTFTNYQNPNVATPIDTTLILIAVIIIAAIAAGLWLVMRKRQS